MENSKKLTKKEQRQQRFVKFCSITTDKPVDENKIKNLTLFEYVINGDLISLQQAIGEGLDPLILNDNSLTLLYFSIIYKHIEIFRFLLKFEIDINRQYSFGGTALLHATFFKLSEMVHDLLMHKANPNIPDKNGYAPIHWAAYHGDFKICELLIANGCNLNALDNKGESALYKAARQNKDNIVALLITKGADVNSLTKEGANALLYPARDNYFEVCKLLADAGCNYLHSDEHGRSPLSMAQAANNSLVLKLFAKNNE